MWAPSETINAERGAANSQRIRFGLSKYTLPLEASPPQCRHSAYRETAPPYLPWRPSSSRAASFCVSRRCSAASAGAEEASAEGGVVELDVGMATLAAIFGVVCC